MSSKDLIKDKIMKAALKLLNQFGYGSLSLSELARQAKITKQRLYYHFPTPEDVIQILAAQWSQTGQTCATEALARSNEVGALRVLAICEGMFDWMKQYEELSRLGMVLFQSSPHVKSLNHFMNGARVVARERIKSFLILDKHFAKMKPKELEEVITSIHSHMYGFYFYIVAMNDFANLKTHQETCLKGLRRLIEAR